MDKNSHKSLLAEYIEALEWAVNEARTLREEDLARLIEDFHGDEARAREAFAGYGPLYTDPYIIGAVREYWLACDALNRAEPETAVAPHIFVLEWLREARADLAQIVAEYPYWPIGQDAKGGWL
jgi:hypothetical protein